MTKSNSDAAGCNHRRMVDGLHLRAKTHAPRAVTVYHYAPEPRNGEMRFTTSVVLLGMGQREKFRGIEPWSGT